MARPHPPHESNSIKQAFLKILEEELGSVHLTCKIIGIPASTYYYWKDHDKGFRLAAENIKECLWDKMEKSLVQDALTKGGSDRIFYMKTQMRHRGYGEKMEEGDEVEPYKPNETDKELLERIKSLTIAEYKSSNETI